MNKLAEEAYELGVKQAMVDAGLVKQSKYSDLVRAMLAPITAAQYDDERKQKILSTLLGAVAGGTAGGIGGAKLTDSGVGALGAIPGALLGGAAGHQLHGLLQN